MSCSVLITQVAGNRPAAGSEEADTHCRGHCHHIATPWKRYFANSNAMKIKPFLALSPGLCPSFGLSWELQRHKTLATRCSDQTSKKIFDEDANLLQSLRRAGDQLHTMSQTLDGKHIFQLLGEGRNSHQKYNQADCYKFDWFPADLLS